MCVSINPDALQPVSQHDDFSSRMSLAPRVREERSLRRELEGMEPPTRTEDPRQRRLYLTYYA